MEDAPDPCHLIELVLEPEIADEPLDLRAITQEAPGQPGDTWQTPSDDPAGRDVGVPAGPLHLSTELG